MRTIVRTIVRCFSDRPRLCPRLLPTSKAWLLSTRSFCCNGKVYGVFRSDNLEKLGKKSILSWRCHKFKQKRRYSKWNFTFFRLDKCERWQQLPCQCFETLIVCPCLLIANTTLLAFKTLFLFFFQNLPFQIGSAAYLRMRLIHGRLRYILYVNHFSKFSMYTEMWQRH